MIELPTDLLKDWDIVVIDDEEDSLMVAQVILDEYGANTHVATNGEEGLTLIRNVRPKFVISDLSMPVLDGWGVINNMLKDPAIKDIPAIALTAHAMVGDRERAVAAGFHNYLTKPLTVETFIQDLVNLLIDIPNLANELNI
ncbi:MAG: response regulator [Chloroflexota bacterium]